MRNMTHILLGNGSLKLDIVRESAFGFFWKTASLTVAHTNRKRPKQGAATGEILIKTERVASEFMAFLYLDQCGCTLRKDPWASQLSSCRNRSRCTVGMESLIIDGMGTYTTRTLGTSCDAPRFVQ